jgi:hypothetical protein
MLFMSVTRATFQEPMFWLKAGAKLNVLAMFETDATFHEPMSALNVGMFAKSENMLLTALTSQSAMLPYVVAAVVGLVIHAVAAVAMLPFVMAVQSPTLNDGHAAWSVAPHAA